MKTLTEYAALVDQCLSETLKKSEDGTLITGDTPSLLCESMRYSVFAGGKRLRPALLLAAADMLGGDLAEAVVPACALEMIHTYSLIHDDLPCMDDDAMRRGKPTNHVVFGEGQAMLAGDGLLTQAFEMMACHAMQDTARVLRRVSAMHAIASCAGVHGMVGGQCLDLSAERDHLSGDELLEYIHRTKTAALFSAAMRAGGYIGGATDEQLSALDLYGLNFGLLFQTADDILDVVGDAAALGKATGADAAHGKLTSVSVWGLEGARENAHRFAGEAKFAMRVFGERAAFFTALADDMLKRDR